MAEPVTRVTEYTVSCLPEDHPDADSFEVTVSYRNTNQWAIVRGKRCLDANGVWDWERIPSGRTTGWLASHRFDLDTALRLAREAAPKVTLNGHTVADVLAGGATRDCRPGR